MSSDDRSWLMRSVMSMDQAASVPYFYPRLFSLVRLNHTVKLLISFFIERLPKRTDVVFKGQSIERPGRLHEKVIKLSNNSSNGNDICHCNIGCDALGIF